MKALVDTDLKKLIDRKILSAPKFKLSEYLQPSSLDFPIGDKAYLVKQKFLPFSKKISEIIERYVVDEINLKKGATLFKGQTYLIPCLSVNFPDNLFAKISPKSSIGRIDLLVRSVFDNIGLYDTIVEGSKGELWLEISPQSFNVKVQSGISLAQIRVFDKSEKNSMNNFPPIIYDEESGKIIKKETFDNNKMFLSLNVKPDSIVGYVSKPTNKIIDLTKKDFYNWKDFFRKIITKSGNKITLEKDRFYILSTKEKIAVPSKYSIEMIPFSHLIGELRVHYAGFFDPGFGYPQGANGVLEIRPHETLTIYDGQPICLIEIFENKSKPKYNYGEVENNYQYQKGPKLAKYFKEI